MIFQSIGKGREMLREFLSTCNFLRQLKKKNYLQSCLGVSYQIACLRTSDFSTLFPQNERSAKQLIGPLSQLRGEKTDEGKWAGISELSYPNLSRIHLKETLLGPIAAKTSCQIQRHKNRKGLQYSMVQRLEQGLSRSALLTPGAG